MVEGLWYNWDQSAPDARQCLALLQDSVSTVTPPNCYRCWNRSAQIRPSGGIIFWPLIVLQAAGRRSSNVIYNEIATFRTAANGTGIASLPPHKISLPTQKKKPLPGLVTCAEHSLLITCACLMQVVFSRSCRRGTGRATPVVSPACYETLTRRATLLFLKRFTEVIRKESCRYSRASPRCTPTLQLCLSMWRLLSLSTGWMRARCLKLCREVVVSAASPHLIGLRNSPSVPSSTFILNFLLSYLNL